MQLLDVNILVYAARRDSEFHAPILKWLENALQGVDHLGVSNVVLAAVIRVATNPRVFKNPSTLDEILTFIDSLRNSVNYRVVAPGSRHWELFTQLCQQADARGNLVTDAYFAAMAIEQDCEWVSTDRDFARFPGLRWRNPLEQ